MVMTAVLKIAMNGHDGDDFAGDGDTGRDDDDDGDSGHEDDDVDDEDAFFRCFQGDSNDKHESL